MRKPWLAIAFALAATAAAAQGVDSTVNIPTVLPSVDGNYLMVVNPGRQVFWDDFGTGTLDTTNRWSAPTTGGTGTPTAATNAVGATVLGSGTGTGFSLLQSQTTFAGRNPGYLSIQFQVNFEFPVLLNAVRHWGVFTAPGTPTAAAPLTNAVGFTVDTAGKLRAQTWASGSLNFDQDLSVRTTGYGLCNCVPQPADANVHKYQILFRGDNILWFVDGKMVARVLTGAGGPDVNTLNAGALAIGNTPSASATIQLNQVTLGDTSNNTVQLVDGTFAWRKATIGSGGGLSIQTNDPCSSQNKSSVPINITTATTTSLVALSGTTTVYVCGFSVTISPSGTTADTLLFEYGTGGACATAPVALTGTFGNGDLTTAAAVTPLSYGGAGSTIFKSAAGNAICAVSAGTAISIQGALTYVQQ